MKNYNKKSKLNFAALLFFSVSKRIMNLCCKMKFYKNLNFLSYSKISYIDYLTQNYLIFKFRKIFIKMRNYLIARNSIEIKRMRKEKLVRL